MSFVPKSAFVPKSDYDVFLSYAYDDGRKWVDGFYTDLVELLTQRAPGRVKPSIFLDDHELRTGDRVESKILEAIQSSATLLAIASTNYLASPYCMLDELGTFQKLRGSESERIFQIVRVPPAGAPVPALKWTPFCDSRMEFERGGARYNQALAEIAESILARLLTLRREAHSIYVAWPGLRSLRADRESIAGEFRERKNVVLPDRVFTEGSKDETDIRGELRKADLSIHLFDAEADSLADLQLRIAVEEGKPAILVTRNPEEPRQSPLDGSAPIFLGNPNWRRTLIDRVLAKLTVETAQPREAISVFLLYKPGYDEGAAWNARQLLEKATPGGIQILEPHPDDLNIELNLDNYVSSLGSARGVVVCWGEAPQAWFDQLDRRLLGLMMRQKPLAKLRRANYLLEPPSKATRPLKNVFEIRQDQDFDPFVASLEEGA
jgi:hypothetical protein